MSRERVLVVDDERDILELIAYNLRREGFDVLTAVSGEEALTLVRRTPPRAVILDLLLPGTDGIQVCSQIRQDPAMAGVAVLMLTARTEDNDIVSGLEAGADDYVTKPFSPKVLVARLRAALRRRPSTNSAAVGSVVRVHELTIDVSRHEVRCGAEPVSLSATEFGLLEFLARNPGLVFSRARIIDAVKGTDYPVTERAVDVQVLGLRKKLGSYGAYIETVRGVGYRMRAE